MRNKFLKVTVFNVFLATIFSSGAEASNPTPELRLPSANYLKGSGLPADLTLEEYRYILSGQATPAQREVNKKNVLDFRQEKAKAGNKDLTLGDFLQSRGVAQKGASAPKKLEAIEGAPRKEVKEVVAETVDATAKKGTIEIVPYEESYDKRKAAKRTIGKNTQAIEGTIVEVEELDEEGRSVGPKKAEAVRVEIEDQDEHGRPIQVGTPRAGKKDLNLD